MKVDLLIHSASQVVTCASPLGPKRGGELGDVGVIADGAVAVGDGLIVAVGPTDLMRAAYPAQRELDASGHVVCPGFVDCHTHLIFAGDRVAEFEMKLAGAAYLDILRAGGGILSTMAATRLAPLTHLVADGRARLDLMLALGTTTVESKSGYGLETETELAELAAMTSLAQTHACEIVPTLLGAHAVPPEFSGRADAYVDLVVEEMIPAAAAWYAGSPFAARQTPFFCDAFCEANVFDVAQTRRVLQAGMRHGLVAKIHADEFVNLGGVALALELGAVSADHLDVTSAGEIAQMGGSNTVAVLLPAVNFHLGSHRFADARAFVAAGAAVALATDLNPGSAPVYSLPFVMGLACRYQKLTPAEAFNACTINAAHAIGLGARIGSLEPGKQADILLIDAPDYRHVAYWMGGNLVERVFKRGVDALDGSRF